MLTILPKLKDSIKKVDELCSVIFSAAFTLLLMCSFMAIITSLYLMAYNLLIPYVSSYILLAPGAILIIASFFQVAFSVYANHKSNKSKKKLQIRFFNFNRIFTILFYGPLYKYLLQVTMIFGSNFKKKKSIVYLILLFICSGVFVCGSQIVNTNIPYLIARDSFFNSSKSYASYYKSENATNTFLLNPEIDSDKIESNVLKLFIPIYSHEENMRRFVCNEYIEDTNKLMNEQRKERRASNLNCYHLYNTVLLNNKTTIVEFLTTDHPLTEQFGVVTFIDLSNIKKGMNRLIVKKSYGGDESTEWSIPFYYNPT